MTDKDKRMNTPTIHQIRAWWKEMQTCIPNAIKYNLWSKSQWRCTAQGLQNDNKTLLEHIEELQSEAQRFRNEVAEDMLAEKEKRQKVWEQLITAERKNEELQSRLDGLEIIGLAALEFVRDSYPPTYTADKQRWYRLCLALDYEDDDVREFSALLGEAKHEQGEGDE